MTTPAQIQQYLEDLVDLHERAALGDRHQRANYEQIAMLILPDLMESGELQYGEFWRIELTTKRGPYAIEISPGWQFIPEVQAHKAILIYRLPPSPQNRWPQAEDSLASW